MVSDSTPVDLDLLAQHRGKQFQVRLRAIRDGAGLVKSRQPLEVGGRLILHVPNAKSRRAAVQLFASVVKHYQKQKAYALRWEKLVSPSGTGALTAFLDSTLGVNVLPGTALAEESVEGEMAYYEFASQQLHLPNQGKVTHLNDLAPVVPDMGSNGGFGTSPLPLEADAGKTTSPVANGGGNGSDPSAGQSVEAQAKAAAQEADANSKPFFKEGEEVVELFGMTVSKDNWDRLENLEYTGSHPAGSSTPKKTPSPPKQTTTRRPTPPPSRSFKPPEEAKEGDNKVSRFFRKIADKLADKD